jgi:hypothetical protein
MSFNNGYQVPCQGVVAVAGFSGKSTFPLRISVRPALNGNGRTRSSTMGEPFAFRSVNTSPDFVTCATKIRRSIGCPSLSFVQLTPLFKGVVSVSYHLFFGILGHKKTTGIQLAALLFYKTNVVLANDAIR